MEPLEPRDLHYFNDCASDHAQLMNPIIIKRCVIKSREGFTAEYPDDPQSAERYEIHTRGDWAFVSASETEKSGGVILVGDVKIWTFIPLRGPESDTMQVPSGVADIVNLAGVDYVVVGMSDRGFFTDGVTPGYSTLLRRRAIGHGGQTGNYDPKK